VREHTSAYASICQHTSGICFESRNVRQMPAAEREGERGQTPAYASICQHTSAYVSIRQHTSAYASTRQHTSAYVSIRQHTSAAYVSIRQHTSAYVSIRERCSERGTWVELAVRVIRARIRQHTSAAYVSIRQQRTSAYVSIREHTSAAPGSSSPCASSARAYSGMRQRLSASLASAGLFVRWILSYKRFAKFCSLLTR
jgi:hypothetical protein